jgi:hypothetical protein
LEKKPTRARFKEALQQLRDLRIEINLPLGIRRLDSTFHATMPRLLLDGNRRAVRREVLVDLYAKSLTNTEILLLNSRAH